MTDLVSQDQIVAALAGLDLTDPQAALLPTLGATASRLVRDWCYRDFTRSTYDEVYGHDFGHPFTLRQYPVNAILRCSTGPGIVLTIANSDGAVQRADVAMTTTGDADSGLDLVGITLSATASGVTTPTPIAFASLSPPTLTSLASAVSANPGWTATIQPGYGLWGASELMAEDGPWPASGANAAHLRAFTQDLAIRIVDPLAGVVRTSVPLAFPAHFERFYGDGPGELRDSGGLVRVLYDAGYDAIPAPVQQATIEVAKAMLERLGTDTTISKEVLGAYQWEARDVVAALPSSVVGPLSLYRNMSR